MECGLSLRSVKLELLGGVLCGQVQGCQLLLSILSPPPRIDRPQLLSTEIHPPSQRTKGNFTEMREPGGSLRDVPPNTGAGVPEGVRR